jgi:hypothetical protein
MDAKILGNNLLYKYLPISINTLRILISNELWFGHPDYLNDPYEYEFIYNDLKTGIPNKVQIPVKVIT